MRKNLLKLSTFLVVVLLVFGLAGCNKDKYKYPSQTPTISNPSSAYLTIGNTTITNERLYRRTLVNFGLERFNDWLDSQILANIEIDQAEFTAFKNRLIYGVSDLADFTGDKEETLTRYTNNMIAAGYFDEAARNAYHELEYRRFAFAKSKLIAEIEARDEDKPYFSEATYEAFYNNTYKPTVSVILLTFNSDAEARKLMSKYGVDVNRITPLGWTDKTNGKEFTETEIKQIFINMYNDIYGYYNDYDEILYPGHGYTETDGAINFDLTNNLNEYSKFVFTYKELSNISATIANKVFSGLTLDGGFHKSYTTAPILYLSNFFMALKVKEVPAPSLEEVRDEIFEELLIQTLSQDLINYHLYVEREKANIQIYDEALESLFVQTYNDTFTARNITDYKKYVKTTGESNSIVAEITVNGTKKTLSADQFFTTLKDMHGVTTSIDYMHQYILLSDSKYAKIYNPVSDTIIDQAKYQSLFDKEVKRYKDELEKGTFASIGMPKNYGWNNFLRDYLGLMDEKELLINAALYTEALNLFTKDQYTYENADPEKSIKAQMEKIYNEFFNVTAFSVAAFYDYDLNASADDPEKWTEAQTLKAQELLDLVFEEAVKSTKTTMQEKLTEVINNYKVAGHNDATWGEFKLAGLKLNIATKGTYTASSTLHANYKTTLKEIWDQLKAEELVGKVLDTKSNPARISDSFKTTSGLNKAVVLETKNATYISESSNPPIIYPTEELIEKYLVYKKPDEEKTNEELNMPKPTTKEITAIETYYLTAIKNLESSKRIDAALVALRAQLMSEQKITFANANDTSKYQAFMDAYQALTND